MSHVTTTSATRERCYGCYRPTSSCFCHRIPRIDNQTEVLLVQHPRERRHAFNTARIVHQALANSSLVIGYPRDLTAQRLPLGVAAALLYPGDDVPLLADLRPAQRPRQLVVIDGTWHHAKTIVRDVPELRRLPQVRLAPTTPGRFRIRREPDDHSLSTLEAVVAALELLEPHTSGLAALLAAFDTMVERQLAHPRMKRHWRRNARRRNDGGNLPKVFRHGLKNIVVAYGESADHVTPRGRVRVPIYWVAEHLGTGQRFACRMRASQPLSTEFLRHLRLDAADFQQVCSPVEFRSAWNQFCRPGDTTVVYNKRTIDLLRNIDAACDRYIVLKSIRMGQQADSRAAGSLDEMLKSLPLQPEPPRHRGRAGERLANSVALVKHLATRAPGVRGLSREPS